MTKSLIAMIAALLCLAAGGCAQRYDSRADVSILDSHGQTSDPVGATSGIASGTVGSGAALGIDPRR